MAAAAGLNGHYYRSRPPTLPSSSSSALPEDEVKKSTSTPRIRVVLEQHFNASPRTSGTVDRKKHPGWMVRPEDQAYHREITKKLDMIWMHRKRGIQLPIVEACHDTVHGDFSLCQDRQALLGKFEAVRYVGEPTTITRDDFSARLRLKGENILNLYYNTMTIITQARRSFYIVREEVEVLERIDDFPAFLKPLLGWLSAAAAPPRRLVFYTLVVNQMEYQLRKHLVKFARYHKDMRSAHVELPPDTAVPESDPSTSCDEIDITSDDDDDA
jgi:hypothetical protein